jgi:hypothetical protein
MRQARFGKSHVTTMGRIGHPAPLGRKMVRCVGVVFEDRWEGKKWTLRMYEAYRDEWPAVDVWTVQHLEGAHRDRGSVYSNQRPVGEDRVPDEVKAHALAELVKLRLRGEVRG